MNAARPRIRVMLLSFFGIFCLSQNRCATPFGPDDQRPVRFSVHLGYSVKGSFVESGPTTWLVFDDKAGFDAVLYWISDHNPHEPIPDGDFQSKILPVVIKKGNSYWEMTADRVCYVQADKTLHVYYRAIKVADDMSWVAAIPLVVSIQAVDYSLASFYENGELVGSVTAAR